MTDWMEAIPPQPPSSRMGSCNLHKGELPPSATYLEKPGNSKDRQDDKTTKLVLSTPRKTENQKNNNDRDSDDNETTKLVLLPIRKNTDKTKTSSNKKNNYKFGTYKEILLGRNASICGHHDNESTKNDTGTDTGRENANDDDKTVKISNTITPKVIESNTFLQTFRKT